MQINNIVRVKEVARVEKRQKEAGKDSTKDRDKKNKAFKDKSFKEYLNDCKKGMRNNEG